MLSVENHHIMLTVAQLNVIILRGIAPLVTAVKSFIMNAPANRKKNFFRGIIMFLTFRAIVMQITVITTLHRSQSYKTFYGRDLQIFLIS